MGRELEGFMPSSNQTIYNKVAREGYPKVHLDNGISVSVGLLILHTCSVTAW